MKKFMIMTGFIFVLLGSTASVVAADAVHNSQNGIGNSEVAQKDHPTPPEVNPHGDELPPSN
ncbi:hypothetical protein SAMN04487936_102541 [Halobacillus dabanensis]|uniref:Phr family secreted Rap phosphatase inhibitor n=1 Tax=Halobacillus dabanensis TaxID=240302 RepID=A0A1I3S968_HALDA|nr:hypothetical protein [Halobacillus dabanensis]SFJ54081.1 hypothetical protein SAMN04487936_102541 [Halobacillus dabanensis]